MPLDYLLSETPFEPFTTDNYFEQYDKPTVFDMNGQEIVVTSKQLAALRQLRNAWEETGNEGRIKYLSTYQGHINDEIQDRLKAQLIQAIFKFRFDR